ncbi:YesL family protein [Paenibacillus sp. J2TS4]|uniref:YesL family protein n=1 Tax=Paenibacillus sp. J2TS4 TaxID=2807194 RepID=UPI001B21926C|nr:DUF624 domain-containing protein [Paenibacillus sp. J2TS4]GIP34393.1 hypothetical protein J2TS4_36030 [Paenibacillus sp. J2TS4]
MKSAKVNRFFEWIMNLALLNFLWILLSLPVITVFAASAGLCRVIQQHRNEMDREGIMSLYWKSFVRQLLPATCLGLVMMLLLLIVIANFSFANQFAAIVWLYAVLMAWSIFVGSVYISLLLFIFPVLALQEQGVSAAIKTAFLLGLQKLPHSLAMAGILTGILLAYYFIPVFIPIIGISLLAFLVVEYTDKTVRSGNHASTMEISAS